MTRELSNGSRESYFDLTLQTQDKKPQFFIGLVNVLSVEEVDDGAFGHALCFQV